MTENLYTQKSQVTLLLDSVPSKYHTECFPAQISHLSIKMMEVQMMPIYCSIYITFLILNEIANAKGSKNSKNSTQRFLNLSPHFIVLLK